MSKHTPGPWRVEDIKNQTLLNIVPLAQQKAFKRDPWNGNYYQIASVLTSYCRSAGKSKFEHPKLPEGEALANARLIAAAPELLEALIACLRDCESTEEIHPRSRITLSLATRQQALSAIQKATTTV